MMPKRTDPLLERCANCGETWEDHEADAEGRYCPDLTPFIAEDEAQQRAEWRSETREDRMAGEAAARGM